MEKITMFTLKTCPYCRQALGYMDTLFAENPDYASLEVQIIDEQEHPDISDQHDYYYVPTYYVGGEKLHEGAASLEKVRRVFDTAIGR